MKVSLVTACKNRNDCLKAVLPSWLSYKQITEIIIVDWNSDTPLKGLEQLDKRIKIIRVNDEKYYVPSQANNLAACLASEDYILRIDTDYFLNPYYNFFDTYKIDNTNFVSGEPEINDDRENNPYYKYLFGLLFVTKENFKKVNGYNENIGYYYSHEDKDIFERLKLLGLKQIKLKNNHSVIHIPHSDKKRFEFFEGGQNSLTNDYNTVEMHIGNNLNIFKFPTSHYVENVVNWDIKKTEEQYFEAKKGDNVLSGLPSVNCVSLEESEERRHRLLKQFSLYGINNINFLISKRYTESNDRVEGKYARTLNEGTAGCCVSHLKMIQNWYNTTQEEYGFFCEDDLSLETVNYWTTNWKKFVSELPQDWNCVQLLTIRKDNLSLNLRDRLWNDWGATAYILKREYAHKIIQTYIKDDKYILELPEPNTGIQPLIENLLFTIGKTYTIPLLIENIDFSSTFVETDNDVDAATLHKNNHIIAAQKVLQLWKNKDNDLFNFATNIDNPENNFKMGEFYFYQGHTAPALSYFLRCAERTDNILLAYEALIFGYLCYKEQKIRDETAKSLIMHAVCLMPERPEARWLLSVFYEQKEQWMYAYYHANRGLEGCELGFESLKSFKDYPGKIGLLFQKAIVGYWWGKNDECKNILLDLYNNYKLNETYRLGVKNNLKRIGVEIS